jgi:putative PIN family toxin of toxin-antitoxin system
MMPGRSAFLAILDEKIEICISDEIITELERVLKNKIRLTKSKTKSVLSTLSKFTENYELGAVSLSSKLRDPNDLHVLELCNLAEAVILITEDKDFAGIEAGHKYPKRVVSLNDYL